MNMSEQRNECQTWEEVILSFLQSKIEKEEEEFLKNKIKMVSDLYKKHNYFGNKEIEFFFDSKKNKKNQTQSSLEFLRLQYKQMLCFNTKPDGLELIASDDAYHKRSSELFEKYDPHNWISKASQDASSVSFATHVIKLTHSKIDSSSIYDQINSKKYDILTTSSLKEIIIDGAVAGNQFAPVFQFLELELKGKKLADVFKDESNTVLNKFAISPEDLALLNSGFKKALSNNRLSSHFLAKQIYYPISKGNNLSEHVYHLLCNIPTSYLAHAIFLSISKDTEKTAKEQRNKNKYYKLPLILYPQKANIKVTASNHSNASQLNGKRGGRLHLFSTQPPIWHSQLKPPVNSRSFFQTSLNSYRVKETIDYLREFLLRFQRIDLSIKNPEKKKWIDQWVIQIIDEIMIYAMSIQNLPAGWSRGEDVKLKMAFKYFLDPYRQDEQFQKERQEINWQNVICKDFANWLNGILRGKKKLFTPQPEHTRIWMKLMEKELMGHSQTIEWDIKEQKRKEKI